MKIKQLKEMIKNEDDEREVVLHHWDGEEGESIFWYINPSCTPHVNSENLFCLVLSKCEVKPIRKEVE